MGIEKNRKRCLFIKFPGCIYPKTGKAYKWMPTYKQVEQIVQGLKEIEQESWLNKEAE